MLFSAPPISLASDVWLLVNYAPQSELMACTAAIEAQAPLRHMQVPSGKQMAVSMTNCGAVGWTSGPQGYRYLPHDPASGKAWPAIPEQFARLAREAAALAGWPNFVPDACLINRYTAGAGMGLHQDRDERDLQAPIVSVSLGASCRFMLGGLQRGNAVRSFELHGGDVLVWGGSARLVFHGVHRLPASSGPRYNLTFRKAL